MKTGERVFIVYHVHELPSGEEDSKLIGVYATEQDAAEAIERAKQKPGFKEHPDDFSINAYTLGKDHWTEGFVTLFPEDM
jgi:hypothetical protein